MALGIPNPPIIHINDVSSRRSLSKFWRKLLCQLNQTVVKLIFGQDHQYSVPARLLTELRISGPWRTAMEAMFCGERFGKHAKHGAPDIGFRFQDFHLKIVLRREHARPIARTAGFVGPAKDDYSRLIRITRGQTAF